MDGCCCRVPACLPARARPLVPRRRRSLLPVQQARRRRAPQPRHCSAQEAPPDSANRQQQQQQQQLDGLLSLSSSTLVVESVGAVMLVPAGWGPRNESSASAATAEARMTPAAAAAAEEGEQQLREQELTTAPNTCSTDSRMDSSASSSSALPPVLLGQPGGSATSSFSSVDDELSAAEVEAARAAAAAQAAPKRAGADASEPWWPPPEFSALVGLVVAAGLCLLTNVLLCKPAHHGTYRYGRHAAWHCAGCCAAPGVQARHHQYLQRQPQLLLPPLPLPLRPLPDTDLLATPDHRQPALVPLHAPADEGLGVGGSLMAAQEWLQGRFAYHLQQIATASVSTKVLLLWLAALPFIILFGVMYKRASGGTLSEAMYKVYALLYRVPGVGIAKEPNMPAYIVANTVFLAGVFSFAAVLGIVSDEVKLSIKASRSGNYPMRLSGHIVVINWNGSSTALLRQIAAAYAEGGLLGNGAPWPWSNRPPVVVLADKPKAAMDAAVHEMLRDRGLQLEVHTREGNPFKLSDLRKVAASKASAVIVLHPDTPGRAADAEAIKTSVVMSLTALGPAADQRVVVTGPVPDEQSAMHSLGVSARLVGGSAVQALELPHSQLISRLVTQTAAQPGILTCWLDILALATHSAQFHCVPVPPGLAGRRYVDVRRAFSHAVVCGYRTPAGQAVLNPSDSDVPPADGKLILLGRGGAVHTAAPSSSQVYENAAAAAAERLKRERTYKSKARNILVAAWPVEDIPHIMTGFSTSTPPNSSITFTLQGEPPASWPSRLGNCRFNFVSTEHPTSVKVLLEAGIKTADAVVLGSGSSSAGELESDARILSAVLQVQDAVLASKRRDAPHLVAPIRRYATSKLASQYLDVLAAEQSGSTTSAPAAAGAAAAKPAAASTSVAAAAAPVPAATASAAAAVAAPAAPAAAGNGPPGSSNGSNGSNAGATAAEAAAPAQVAQAGASASTSGGGGGLLSPVSGLLLSALGGGGASPAVPAAAAAPQQPIISEPEFLVPNDVTSALTTQVVSEATFSDLMRALLLSDGSRIFLRHPASFNLPIGVPVTFAEVEEAVRLTGAQTALGFIRGRNCSATGAAASSSSSSSAVVKGLHSAKPASGRRKAVMGPAASAVFVFGEQDRIVVLAKDLHV